MLTTMALLPRQRRSSLSFLSWNVAWAAGAGSLRECRHANGLRVRWLLRERSVGTRFGVTFLGVRVVCRRWSLPRTFAARSFGIG